MKRVLIASGCFRGKSIKRPGSFLLLVLVVLLAAVQFGCSSNSNASTPQSYTNASLNGEFLFDAVEVNLSTTLMEHCEQSGAMNFDGNGGAAITSTKRCADAFGNVTTSTQNDSQAYSVNSDGSFTLGTAKGHIVLGGNGILLDGTGATSYSSVIRHVIGMKR